MEQIVIGEVTSMGVGTLGVLASGVLLTQGDMYIAAGLGELRVGDRVVLATADGQSYYLLCKAVGYG